MNQHLSPRPFAQQIIAVLLVIAHFPAHLAVAAEIDLDAILDSSLQGVLSEQAGTALSTNTIGIVQEAILANQQAHAGGAATTVIAAGQVLDAETLVDVVQENCGTGTGLALCLQDAIPQIVYEALQHVTATASNVLNIAQENVMGNQVASLSGAALVDVDVSQLVEPNTIVNIFQDCYVAFGGCIQRAMPEVLTLASQIISAAAVNKLGIDQETESGSLQQAAIEATAQSIVQAEQIVHPRTIVNIVQACKVDLGLCIQRATPFIQTLTEQLINAHADNILAISQDGADTQQAAATASGMTMVTTLQDVLSETELHYEQVCSVAKGLCIQAKENGQPVFYFSDGETTQTGEYNGVFDDSALNDNFNRKTVGQVASGICPPGEGLCSNVEQLLLWLFGPEPEPEQAVGSSHDSASTGSAAESSAHRGHQTNHIGSVLSFIAQNAIDAAVAPGAFGGDTEEGSGLSESDRTFLCSMKRAVPADSDDAVWQWTAEKFAAMIGGKSDAIYAALMDPATCPQPTVAKAKADGAIQFVSVADDGPLSTNPLWNKCVRGQMVTPADIDSNTDRDEDGKPKTCADYHTQASWYHPDLGIYFIWDRVSGALELPDGYFPALI